MMERKVKKGLTVLTVSSALMTPVMGVINSPLVYAADEVASAKNQQSYKDQVALYQDKLKRYQSDMALYQEKLTFYKEAQGKIDSLKETRGAVEARNAEKRKIYEAELAKYKEGYAAYTQKFADYVKDYDAAREANIEIEINNRINEKLNEKTLKKYDLDVLDYQMKKAAIDKTLKSIKDSKDAYEAAMVEYDQKKAVYEEQLAQFDQEKTAFEAAVKEQEAAKKELEDYKADYEKKLLIYNGEMKQYKEGYENYKTLYAKYQEEIAKRETTVTEENTYAKEYQEKYDAYLKDLDRYQKELNEYAEDNNKFLVALGERDQAAADIIQLNKTYQAQMDKYKDALKTYDQEIETYKEKLKKYEEDFQNYTKKETQYEADKEAYKEKKTKYDAHLKAYNAVKSRYDSAKTAADNTGTAIDKLKALIKETETNIKTMNQSLKNATKEQQATQIAQLKEQLAKVEYAVNIYGNNVNLATAEDGTGVLDNYATAVAAYRNQLNKIYENNPGFNPSTKEEENYLKDYRRYAEDYLNETKAYIKSILIKAENFQSDNKAVSQFNDAVTKLNTTKTTLDAAKDALNNSVEKLVTALNTLYSGESKTDVELEAQQKAVLAAQSEAKDNKQAYDDTVSDYLGAIGAYNQALVGFPQDVKAQLSPEDQKRLTPIDTSELRTNIKDNSQDFIKFTMMSTSAISHSFMQQDYDAARTALKAYEDALPIINDSLDKYQKDVVKYNELVAEIKDGKLDADRLDEFFKNYKKLSEALLGKSGSDNKGSRQELISNLNDAGSKGQLINRLDTFINALEAYRTTVNTPTDDYQVDTLLLGKIDLDLAAAKAERAKYMDPEGIVAVLQQEQAQQEIQYNKLMGTDTGDTDSHLALLKAQFALTTTLERAKASEKTYLTDVEKLIGTFETKKDDKGKDVPQDDGSGNIKVKVEGLSDKPNAKDNGDWRQFLLEVANLKDGADPETVSMGSGSKKFQDQLLTLLNKLTIYRDNLQEVVNQAAAYNTLVDSQGSSATKVQDEKLTELTNILKDVDKTILPYIKQLVAKLGYLQDVDKMDTTKKPIPINATRNRPASYTQEEFKRFITTPNQQGTDLTTGLGYGPDTTTGWRLNVPQTLNIDSYFGVKPFEAYWVDSSDGISNPMGATNSGSATTIGSAKVSTHSSWGFTTKTFRPLNPDAVYDMDNVVDGYVQVRDGYKWLEENNPDVNKMWTPSELNAYKTRMTTTKVEVATKPVDIFNNMKNADTFAKQTDNFTVDVNYDDIHVTPFGNRNNMMVGSSTTNPNIIAYYLQGVTFINGGAGLTDSFNPRATYFFDGSEPDYIEKIENMPLSFSSSVNGSFLNFMYVPLEKMTMPYSETPDFEVDVPPVTIEPVDPITMETKDLTINQPPILTWKGEPIIYQTAKGAKSVTALEKDLELQFKWAGPNGFTLESPLEPGKEPPRPEEPDKTKIQIPDLPTPPTPPEYTMIDFPEKLRPPTPPTPPITAPVYHGDPEDDYPLAPPAPEAPQPPEVKEVPDFPDTPKVPEPPVAPQPPTYESHEEVPDLPEPPTPPKLENIQQPMDYPKAPEAPTAPEVAYEEVPSVPQDLEVPIPPTPPTPPEEPPVENPPKENPPKENPPKENPPKDPPPVTYEPPKVPPYVPYEPPKVPPYQPYIPPVTTTNVPNTGTSMKVYPKTGSASSAWLTLSGIGIIGMLALVEAAKRKTGKKS